MNLLLGMLIGAALVSGDPALGPVERSLLAPIPLRCLAALDESEGAYRTCRYLTMHVELNAAKAWGEPKADSICYRVQRGYDPSWKPMCDADQHITWEIAALKQIGKALAERKERSR